jgi:hypothetical protein
VGIGRVFGSRLGRIDERSGERRARRGGYKEGAPKGYRFSVQFSEDWVRLEGLVDSGGTG